MVQLYHYTDRAGKNGIYSTKLIRATDAGDGLGKVVRFTELDNTTDRAVLIANNWGDQAPQNAAQKLKFWFWFELKDLPAGTAKVTTLGNRNIWICSVDVPIREKTQNDSRRPRRRKQPLQSDANRTVLYHYTDEAGKNAIHADGVIKAVKPHRGQGLGAKMPVAVYFTEIIPTASKEDLMFNMYGTRDVANHPEWLARTRFWFKFDSRDLPRVRKRSTKLGRNEWVCKQDVHIDWSTLLGSSAKLPAFTKKYYHYTDKAGRDAINKCGYIAPQFRLANLSSVVKLTDLAPSASKTVIVRHWFGNSEATPKLLDQIEYWFSFDESELRDLTQSSTDRRLWTTPIAVYTRKSTLRKALGFFLNLT